MAAFPKHNPPRHTNSAQLQAAHGVYMDKEAYEGDEYQTKGSCRSCVPRPNSGLATVLLGEPLQLSRSVSRYYLATRS
jgi:hypothetical protein